ncbi:hypothetical protein G3M48_000440, partial [Beauveria asiatica]
MTGMTDESALKTLQYMAEYVQKSFADLNDIQPPQVVYDHTISQINVVLHRCFERLREKQPHDAGSIENEIVRYSGGRKMLEVNGLRDAENACR